jgi:hypothetical protein
MGRNQFFCGLFVLTAINGLEPFVVGSVITNGWYGALLETFGISAVVLMACIAGSMLLYDSRLDEVITIPDRMVALGVLAMTLLPFAKFSWMALTVLGLYILGVSPAGSKRRRGALIALAATGPMLWGPFLMEIFGPAILQADAILVSSLLGTAHSGNVYSGAIGSSGIPAQFVIYPDCSSLHGMSIAVLTFITINNTLGVAWSPRHLAYGLLATLSVLAVNASRLSLIGLFPSHFSAIHGSPGSDIAAWLSLALVVTVSLLGVGREAFVRA